MKRLIQEAWNKYNSTVLDPRAGEIQRRETQIAFYAGAASLFSGLFQMLSSETDEPTEREMQTLSDISQELDEFEELLK